MRIALVKDADKKVEKLVSKKDVQSILKNVNDAVADFVPDKFAEGLQSLIVKVAQIISEVAQSVKLDESSYPSAIKYLCKDVLKDKGQIKDFEALGIDKASKDSQMDEGLMAESIYKYHRLIGALVDSCVLDALEGIIITAVIGSAKKANKSKKQEKSAEEELPKKQEKKAEATQAKKQEEPKAKKEPDKKQDPVKTKETVAAPTATQTKKAVGDKSKAVYVDEAVGVLTVELTRGDGWYEVGGLSKKDFFQCMIKVGFEGNGKYELRNAQVEVNSFKVDNREIKESIKTSVLTVKPGESELNMEMEKSGMKKFLKEVDGDNINRLTTQVSLSITAIVKSGVKTKKLPCDVGCVF